MSRYVIGIDLGTTNSALAFSDSTTAKGDGPAAVERFPIPQLVALNDVSERSLLPSFLYLPSPKEFPVGSLELPWNKAADRVLGSFARDHGAKVPGRLVGSAKELALKPGS
jgi:molecular chaperone DnaK (HSP70)